jgi:hypothetical protein
MAEFFAHNSLNPNKSVRFNITFRYFVIEGEKGEHMWTLEIGTTHPDINGDNISAARAHNISAANFNNVIEDVLVELCAQIDWSPLSNDRTSPYVDMAVPADGTIVSIESSVHVKLKDKLPSSGIDLSSAKIILHAGVTDFDITSEITIDGDPYEYDLYWSPPLRVYSRYE